MDGQFYKQASKQASKQARNSSIELLKIISVFLIVISHVSQTLIENNSYIPWSDFLIPTTATNNISNLFVLGARYLGPLGNSIFFICSAWFLIDNDSVSGKKILKIILDVWTISVSCFFIVFFLRRGEVSLKLIVKQFLPITCKNNWYITCYILFYPIHGLINQLLNMMSQKKLLLFSSLLVFIYVVCNSIVNVYFYSIIIMWISIYTALTYLKLYCKWIDSFKPNLALLFFSLIINTSIIIAINYLGLNISLLNNQVLRLDNNSNPFLLLAAFSLFNLMRKGHFTNKAINYLSALSLFIYIIHENELLRTFYRPALWHYIYVNFGYNHLILWVFVVSAIVFTFGIVMSIIYHHTFEKVVNKETKLLLPKINQIYTKYEKIVIGNT